MLANYVNQGCYYLLRVLYSGTKNTINRQQWFQVML